MMDNARTSEPQTTKGTQASVQQQEARFHELLQHVWKHSPFYRDCYESFGIREKDLPHLNVSNLPFLTKKALMENFDQAVSDSRLKKRELEQWIQDTPNPSQIYRDNFVVLHTSGSSGAIAIFVYDLYAWRLMNGTISTLDLLPRPENLDVGKTRLALFLATHGHFAGVTTSAMLPKSVYDVCAISLLDSTEHAVTQLNKFQPHRISGYPSSVAMLADMALTGKLNIQPQSAILGGEVLTTSMKQKISAAWGAPMYEMYSASESIFIAVRPWGDNDMTIINDLNILEILDDEDHPVSPGQSGRVVLTNLYNYTLPIIRYELNDYAIRGQDRTDTRVTTIQSIQGRVNDALPVILDSGKHDTIHPIILSEFYAAGLINVQFISRSADHVEVYYVAETNIDDSVRREFQRVLMLKGAGRTSFDVVRVGRINADPQTGKVPLVKLDRLPYDESENARDARLIERPIVASQLDFKPALEAGTSGGPDIGYHEQQALLSKCFQPKGTFIEFTRAEIEQSIITRFEHVVQKYPHSIAIKTRQKVLTYSELNYAANRFARAILAIRPGSQDLVGIQLDQGYNLIAAMLGVLKAGKIFVYLDPSFPNQRIVEILKNSQPTLVITDKKSERQLYESTAVTVPHIIIEDVESIVANENPNIACSPDELAWVFYTSGSTGRPKGVVHSHRNLLHNVMTYTNSMHICASDRLSLLHSLNVITSVKNLFGGLLNGATVYPFDVREEGVPRLVTWVIQEGITIFHSVPSLFRHFTESVTGKNNFPELRLIVLGGETVTKTDVEKFKMHFAADCILANLLGSTEMGTFRQYFVDIDMPTTWKMVPAGYEVEDKQIILLGDAGDEVKVGSIGEIAVKSRYLAVGYWRDRDDAEDIFSGDTDPNGGNNRIFPTGDLGRIAADGCLTYLGRKDSLVKIRGHRVELGEIEAVMKGHSAVKQVVAVGQELGSGNQRIVAYVEAAPENSPTTGDLREFLKHKLPDYMIPSSFVVLERLPMTTTGKIDRRSLPMPEETRRVLEERFVSPGDRIEKSIATIWEEVLKSDQVGAYDNFFDLGGHSLLAGQIMSRICDEFQVELSLRTLFDNPTVGGLAEQVRDTQEKTFTLDQLAEIITDLESKSENDVQIIVEEDRD